MSNIKVAILGASGYTGGELLRLLVNHPEVSIEYLTAERHAGKNIAEVFPNLYKVLEMELHPLDPTLLPSDIDFVFLALPHGKSSVFVKDIFERDIKIVDLGADFRISHQNYRKWYGEHPCPELIDEAVYGLPELYREEIAGAKLVANPGCYPLSAILGIAPLLKREVAEADSIIIDSKSGVTGAGRSPSLDLHFCEVNEGMKAYKIGEHRHMPEITEILEKFSGLDVKLHFTPHLIPINRGILSTIYLKLKEKKSTTELLDIYNDMYEDAAFVRVCRENEFPSTSMVRGSNYCDIGVKAFQESNTAIVVSVIDNLVKGASGQAVQNMNLMKGLPESTGIENLPIFP